MPPATEASKLSADAMALGERGKLVTMAGQQRLVGGHDRLAGGKRGLDRAFGRVAGAADHFDQDVDGRIGGKLDRIGDPAELSSDRRRASCRATAR